MNIYDLRTRRLKILNLKSLEVRRLYFDLLLMYKIIFHLNDLDVDTFFHILIDLIVRVVTHISYFLCIPASTYINTFSVTES